MRKTIFAILLGAVLAPSCSRDFVPSEATPVAVTFTLGGVDSGQLTKGAVDNLLAVAAPTGSVSLRLTSTTNALRTYTATPGAEIVVVPDTYRVRAEYVPAYKFECFRGRFYQEPRFSIDTQVVVQEDTEVYALPMTWDCFALVLDRTKVDHYLVMDKGSTPTEPTCWVTDGDLSLVFVTTTSEWTPTNPLLVYALPADELNYQQTTFRLSQQSGSGCVLVRNGYWYSFTPDGVTTQNGVFAFNYPSWTEGDTN